MTVIAKFGTPSLSSQLPPQSAQVGSGLLAGEAIAAGDVCYIASDETIMRSSGAQAGVEPTAQELAASKADGIAAAAASQGEAITLFRGVTFRYGHGLTPGTRLYVGETPGTLDDVPTAGGIEPVALVVDGSRIHIHGSLY